MQVWKDDRAILVDSSQHPQSPADDLKIVAPAQEERIRLNAQIRGFFPLVARTPFSNATRTVQKQHQQLAAGTAGAVKAACIPTRQQVEQPWPSQSRNSTT